MGKTISIFNQKGGVGKTTTKEFIALVLGAKYNTLKTQGNLNHLRQFGGCFRRQGQKDIAGRR